MNIFPMVQAVAWGGGWMGLGGVGGRDGGRGNDDSWKSGPYRGGQVTDCPSQDSHTGGMTGQGFQFHISYRYWTAARESSNSFLFTRRFSLFLSSALSSPPPRSPSVFKGTDRPDLISPRFVSLDIGPSKDMPSYRLWLFKFWSRIFKRNLKFYSALVLWY